jgi:hypothetical protein
MHTRRTVYWLGLIIVVALVLRIFPHTYYHQGELRLVGTCGQLIDEVKPLVSSGNILHFEMFYYPPVAPLIVASTAILIQHIIPKNLFDLGLHCLLITIGLSVATIIPVYLIGREWSPSIGIVAASFYTVTMIAVASSDTVQVYPAFFAMFAVYFFCRSLRTASSLNLALMGITLALGVASKYFPLMLMGMLFLRHFIRNRSFFSSVVVREKTDAMQNYRGSATPAMVWNVVLYIVLVSMVGGTVAGVFYRDKVLTAFKALYDASPHEHPFEHYLPALEPLYGAGLLSILMMAIVAVVLLYAPHLRGISAWEWFKEFSGRNRLWLLPFSSFVGTLIVAIGIPVVLNLNNYLRSTLWLAKDYMSTDGGIFPGGRPAPSYLFSFFPESLGLPLFVLGCIGILFALIALDRKAILLVALALPLYIMLELSSAKVNRFALDLMPLFCLFAAILLVRLMEAANCKAVRGCLIAMLLFTFGYSALYSLAWANFQRPQPDIRVETVRWVNSQIPKGSQIGMKANLWITASPGLLPDLALLKGYQITDYSSYPEYILLPKLLYAVVKQYDELSKAGYIYKEQDWWPQLPPSITEAAVLRGLVNQNPYQMVHEIEKVPEIFGLRFRPQSLGRKTWLMEHAGAYGIQIYKNRSVAANSIAVLPTME